MKFLTVEWNRLKQNYSLQPLSVFLLRDSLIFDILHFFLYVVNSTVVSLFHVQANFLTGQHTNLCIILFSANGQKYRLLDKKATLQKTWTFFSFSAVQKKNKTSKLKTCMNLIQNKFCQRIPSSCRLWVWVRPGLDVFDRLTPLHSDL